MTKKEVINELELKYAAEHEEYKKQYDSYHSGAMAAIDEAIQIVEKLDDTEKIYKHTYFMIGETLVEESKQHITSEKACEQIRKYLNEMLWKLNKESEKEGGRNDS